MLLQLLCGPEMDHTHVASCTSEQVMLLWKDAMAFLLWAESLSRVKVSATSTVIFPSIGELTEEGWIEGATMLFQNSEELSVPTKNVWHHGLLKHVFLASSLDHGLPPWCTALPEIDGACEIVGPLFRNTLRQNSTQPNKIREKPADPGSRHILQLHMQDMLGKSRPMLLKSCAQTINGPALIGCAVPRIAIVQKPVHQSSFPKSYGDRHSKQSEEASYN